jgi:hypothetical protein
MRLFGTLAIGLVALALGAFAATAWVTRSPPPVEAAASVPRTADLPPGRGDGSAAEGAAGTAPAASAATLPRPTGERGHVERMPADRRHGLVAFRRELKSGIAALQDRVAPCAVTGVSFALDVETVDGALRVLEARPEPGAHVDDAAIACARGVLVDARIPAAAAEPGHRWQLSFAAAPRP